ncbi:MAG TPA: alpha/beta hydrolase, partial [Pyrinomonadaceae bacterium]
MAPASVEQSNIFKDVPEKIDARARYLFYLHGRIIEDKGARAVHERHGAYEYEKILETFKAAGFNVISEARAKDTDVGQYAAKVVAQINALLKAGVAPRGVTVVGASKGSGIAMHVSSLLKHRDVNFVIMAGCGQQTLANRALNLYGRVLSIYDASDEGVGTCESLF